MRSYSIRIKENGKKALYSSDIPGIDFLSEYLEGLNLLIIDAQHPEANDLLDLDRYNIDRIILNHGMSDKLKKNLNSLKQKMKMAEENEEITL